VTRTGAKYATNFHFSMRALFKRSQVPARAAHTGNSISSPSHFSYRRELRAKQRASLAVKVLGLYPHLLPLWRSLSGSCCGYSHNRTPRAHSRALRACISPSGTLFATDKLHRAGNDSGKAQHRSASILHVCCTRASVPRRDVFAQGLSRNAAAEEAGV
jgi:hypothetical protein